MEQFHGRIVHIAEGGHNIRKAVPDGKLRCRARRKFIINRLVGFVRHNRHLVIVPFVAAAFRTNKRLVNYPRALDLFRSALQMLPVEKRAVVLTEMINVLLDNAAQIPVDIAQRWKLITVDDTERFLKDYEKKIDISDARTLKNRLGLL